MEQIGIGLSVFLGILFGAIAQFLMGQLVQRQQRGNAKQVLRAEVDLNLAALDDLKSKITRSRGKISAHQESAEDLSIFMHEFDYSAAVGPINQSGYFHMLLGTSGVRQYLNVMRFLNDKNAEVLTNMLRQDHSDRKSLGFFDWIEGELDKREKDLNSVKSKISQ